MRTLPLSWNHHLKMVCDGNLLPRTRIHPLRNQPSMEARIWVKREDETGFGISGFKQRKYASLLPWLIAQGYKQIALLGSGNSGNVTGLSQLLIQNGITPLPFLKKSQATTQGIYQFLTSLLVPENHIHWIHPSEWKSAFQIASDFAEAENQKGIPTLVLPEGAVHAHAVEGAVTLLQDILRNEEENQVEFRHIFMDAGTGFTAAVVSDALKTLAIPSALHVVLLAGDENTFRETQAEVGKWMNERLPSVNIFPHPDLSLYFPANAPSFGSVNASVIRTIRELAAEEGILTDPVYSAKTIAESLRILREENLKGNILIIHSGGTPALSGFRARFEGISEHHSG